MKYMNLYILFTILFFYPSPLQEKKENLPLSLTDFEKEVLVHVNKYRKEKGLSSLKMNTYMSTVAREHSKNMATKRTPFGHAGFNRRYKKVLKNTSANSMAENVIYGYNTPKKAVEGWIDSRGHRKNIKGDYNITGIGAYTARNGNVYVTQLFASK